MIFFCFFFLEKNVPFQKKKNVQINVPLTENSFAQDSPALNSMRRCEWDAADNHFV